MTFDEWLISRLLAYGAYGGANDGAAGRRLHEALQRFQKNERLPVTGIADSATVDLLRKPPGQTFASNPPNEAPEPVWVREARRFMGLKEVSGRASDPTIISWAKRLGGWVAGYYNDDDIPWCGLFVANVIATTLPRESLPANPLSALAWAKAGVDCKPCLGAILIFTRKGGGHVGFYVGEDDYYYYVLGGNQSNSVSITKIEKARLYACRYPKTGGSPGARVRMSAATAISRSEA